MCDKIIKENINENIKEDNDSESEYSLYSDSEEEEEEEQDYSEYVKGWKEGEGMIDGETLKKMAMGTYFKNCNIDEEELYYITFYFNKEDCKDTPGWMSNCYFSIKDLSDKVFYVYYNTSSRFALELGNIHFDDEEEDEDE